MRSANTLRRASAEGGLFVCEVVVAELTPLLGAEKLEQFFLDLEIQFIASSLLSALKAGEMFSVYLTRSRSEHKRVITNFIIGSLALTFTDRY